MRNGGQGQDIYQVENQCPKLAALTSAGDTDDVLFVTGDSELRGGVEWGHELAYRFMRAEQADKATGDVDPLNETFRRCSGNVGRLEKGLFSR